jgi:hypothetical protein
VNLNSLNFINKERRLHYTWVKTWINGAHMNYLPWSTTAYIFVQFSEEGHFSSKIQFLALMFFSYYCICLFVLRFILMKKLLE